VPPPAQTSATPSAAAPPGRSGDRLAAEVRAAANLDAIADVAKRARARLRGEDLASFGRVYADVIIASIQRCAGERSAQGIEVIAHCRTRIVD
jgi:hypothetical protein